MSPVAVLLGIFICVGLAVAGYALLEYFSADRRALRAGSKSSRKQLANALQREHLATAALTKIAANDSGNPILDAQIALEDINRNKLKELDS